MNRRKFLSDMALMAGAAGAASLPDGVQAAPASQTDAAAKPLTGQVALVTGAARGIGRAIAVTFAQQGADVALLDIAGSKDIPTRNGFALATRADLAETERLVRNAGSRALPLVVDVRDWDAMHAAFDRTVRELGRLDIVVANAGFVVWTTYEESTQAQWADVVDVNINGVFHTIHAAVPYLKQRGGRIITLSSIGGRMGVVGNGAYGATKWAVIGITKSAALELGKYNITVNAIAPTAVNTEMYRSEGQRRSTGMTTAEQQDAAMRAYHALPTPALDPQDIADAASFLAGPQAKFVSGLVLDVAAGGNAHYSA